MTAKLNHTIVYCRDREQSSRFMVELLDLPAPKLFGPFAVVDVGDQLSLDFLETTQTIAPQHYAFLVSESEFDTVFERIRQRGLDWWADPYQQKRGEINHWDDGRGLYFEDPDGHLLEILTRSYGSAGTSAKLPHPLVARTLD